MKILLDVMSGDNAPLELIRGAVTAVGEFDCSVVMLGDEVTIRACAAENSLDLSDPRLSIVHTTQVITMEDHPLSIRSKKDSSMAVGLKMLADGQGDAMVSAGNTGALYAGASLIVCRIKGFRRAAIATILPFERPILLIDSGANPEVSEENLEQFAVMGSIYMKNIFKIDSPEVGLLNNGTEEHKGTQLLQDAYVRLKACADIRFIGNVESRSLPYGACDVIVTDGFTGNILLKMSEGLGSYLFKQIKGIYMKNMLTKLSAAVVRDQVIAMKEKFNSSSYGGAPLLGISKPVIKAHGSSDAVAVKNAVKQAIAYSQTGIIGEIARYAASKNTEESSSTKQ